MPFIKSSHIKNIMPLTYTEYGSTTVWVECEVCVLYYVCIVLEISTPLKVINEKTIL